MNPLVVDIIGTWVRAALLALSTFLIQRHIVTAAQGEGLSTMLFAQAINALPGIAALGLSMWQKYSARLKFVTALTVPPGTTEAAVEQKIASGVPLPPVSLPKTAIPLAVKVAVLIVCVMGLSACAGNLSRQVEQSNRHMIKLSETMHNAVAPAPTLTDAQFRSVNTDLNAIAVANLAWTQTIASGGDPIQATVTFFGVFKTQIANLARDAPAIALQNLQADIAAISSKVASAVGP